MKPIQVVGRQPLDCGKNPATPRPLPVRAPRDTQVPVLNDLEPICISREMTTPRVLGIPAGVLVRALAALAFSEDYGHELLKIRYLEHSSLVRLPSSTSATEIESNFDRSPHHHTQYYTIFAENGMGTTCSLSEKVP
jgi:hypothetical protein